MNAKRANFYGIAAILMWSTIVGMARSIMEGFGVAGGCALMYTIGALALFITGGIPKFREMPKSYLLGCGLVFVLYEVFLSQSIGLAASRRQVLEVGMLNYLWPCAIVVMSIWINHEKLRPWVWPGILVAIAGIFRCIASGSDVTLSGFITNISASPLPYGLGFLAALLWGLYSNLSKRFAGSHNAVSLFFALTALVLWIRFFTSSETLSWPGLSTLCELLFIGMVFGFSYSMWETGIHKGNMLLLAVLSYFIPVISMLFASFWLKTTMEPGFWIGVALVVAGSLICWSAGKSKPVELCPRKG